MSDEKKAKPKRATLDAASESAHHASQASDKAQPRERRKGRTKSCHNTQSHNTRHERAQPRKRGAHKAHPSFLDLMGPPPLLADEDASHYAALYDMLRQKFAPRDMIEEIYVRHIMDDAWLVTRYRRLNAHILNMAKPNLGDEIRLNIDRYRGAMMGSEDLLDQRTENLLLYDIGQYACCTHPSDMIAREFEKRITEINLIETMISRCLERMRRSHLTLEDFRAFLDGAMAPMPAHRMTANARHGREEDVNQDVKENTKAPDAAHSATSADGAMEDDPYAP